MKRKIIVCGSYNASLFFRGDILPNMGETVVGNEFLMSAGGKGSNQAIAAKFQEADVRLICKLGGDKYAEDAIALYKKIGLYSSSILRDEASHTGISSIFIDNAGNNLIMVCKGSNMALQIDEIKQVFAEEKDSAYIAAFQLENDVETVMQAIRAAHDSQILTFLDPSPALPLDTGIYPYIDYIKPNEHEAEVMTDIAINSTDAAFSAAQWFLNRGVKAVVITLGSQGAVAADRTGTCVHIPAPQVNSIDTTGAGDVFSASFISALSAGMTLDEAVLYANCSASLSVTRIGVYEAVPTKSECKQFFEANRDSLMNRIIRK